MTGYVWSPPVLTFTVLGQPVGQGRIRSLGKGRPSVHANAKRLKPWRAAVKAAAQTALAGLPESEQFPLTVAVAAELLFTLPYPAVAARKDRPFPVVTSSTNPDIDHLERAVYDALKGVVIADDALVIDARHPKTYPAGVCRYAHPRALDCPGLRVSIYRVLTRGEENTE